MKALSLSQEDSAAFRKILAETAREKGWSLHEVSKILGCSRKTAWTHMQSSCRTNVRRSYALRLADVLPKEQVTWCASHRISHGVRALLGDWQNADSAHKRRRFAYRLAAFITESGAAYYNLPLSQVLMGTTFEGNPLMLTVTFQIPHSQIHGTIVLTYD